MDLSLRHADGVFAPAPTAGAKRTPIPELGAIASLEPVTLAWTPHRGWSAWNRKGGWVVHQGMTVAYRNLDVVVEERIERLRARRAEERLADGAATRVFALRVARAAAGGVGLAAGVALFVGALGSFDLDSEGEAKNTYALFGAWAVAGMAAAIVWPFARRHARAVLRRVPALSGATHDDVTRIDAADPLGDLRRRASKLEIRSVALPLAALAMLMPLTLHLAVATVVSLLHAAMLKASDFGGWIGASVIFVGLAHLALVVQLSLWARSLRDRPTSLLRERIHGTWGRILAVTTGAGLIPAIFFAPSGQPIVLLPAALVAVTGMAFIPFLVVGTAKRIEHERAALELAR